MPLEVFLQHPDIQPLLTNDKIVNGLNFLDKRVGGNVIDFDTANENNKNYDPANAPVLQLPGTRAFTPATPTTDKGKGWAKAKSAASSEKKAELACQPVCVLHLTPTHPTRHALTDHVCVPRR